MSNISVISFLISGCYFLLLTSINHFEDCHRTQSKVSFDYAEFRENLVSAFLTISIFLLPLLLLTVLVSVAK